MRPDTVPALRLETRTLKDQIYEALLKAIVDRRILPGERLLLDDLATQLGVSRTPVRDALSVLASDGLIEPCEGRGFRVTVLSAADLVHLYDLRLMCEQHAVDHSAHNLTPALIARMKQAAAEAKRLHGSPNPADRLRSYTEDERFHQIIVSLGQNPRLDLYFRRLNISVQALRVGPSPLAPEEAARLSGEEHADIVVALSAKDVVRAREAVAFHVNRALERTLLSLEIANSEDSNRLTPLPRRVVHGT